jgi:hypothetical protein
MGIVFVLNTVEELSKVISQKKLRINWIDKFRKYSWEGYSEKAEF